MIWWKLSSIQKDVINSNQFNVFKWIDFFMSLTSQPRIRSLGNVFVTQLIIFHAFFHRNILWFGFFTFSVFCVLYWFSPLYFLILIIHSFSNIELSFWVYFDTYKIYCVYDCHIFMKNIRHTDLCTIACTTVHITTFLIVWILGHIVSFTATVMYSASLCHREQSNWNRNQ